MRQVAILPSGCQISRRVSVLYYSEDRIIYASTLAVYVIDARTFRIQHILSLNQRAITSISISSIDRDLMIVTGRDGTVTYWNIPGEENLAQIMINGSVIAAWNPFLKDQVGILSEESVRLYLWDTDRGTTAVQEIFSVRNDNLKPCVLRWNNKVTGWIAIGCNAGTTFLFRIRDKTHKILQGDAKSNVVDLQWDRLSSSYLLVAYQTFVSLWDAESGEQIHAFEKQAVPITGIAWMDWTAGNFATINGKNTYLKVWNASQRQSLDAIRLPGDTGLLSLCFAAGKRSVLYSCNDGSIGVYDLQSSRLEYQTAANHTETIFSCAYAPNSPHFFATASYDETVKLWCVSDFTVQKTFYGAESIVYSVDWSPNSRMIVGSCMNGLVIIWDVESGRELERHLNHTKASYSAAWNPLDLQYILSTSADCSLVVIQVDPASLQDPTRHQIPTASRKKGPDSYKTQLTLSTVKYRFVHPAGVFGCAWSPHRSSVFSTACQDGMVRIFNFNAQAPLVAVCVGHNARAFSCSWSTLVPGRLASGSDDQTIGVWELDINTFALDESYTTRNLSPAKKLLGHKGFVRALSWNYEHPDLLLSGSWDYSIRLWNVATGQCISEVNDHVADVYAIASHPQQPFHYLSASRDTTIRLWELTGLFTLLRYRSVWESSLDKVIRSSPAVEVEELGSSKKDLLSPILLGMGSKNLNDDLLGIGKKLDLFRSPNRNYSKGEGKDSPGASEGKSDPDEKNSKDESLDPVDRALRYYRLSSFFYGSNGSMDLWENALFSLSMKTTNSMEVAAEMRTNTLRRVFHESEVMSNEKSLARRLESMKQTSRKTGDASNRGEDNLLCAARLYAKLGDFTKYCTIMMDVGKWEAALAVAPAVSMDYWRYVAFMYAQHLSEQASENCVPYYLSIGKDAHAIDYYLQRNDPSSALVVAKMSEQRTDILPDYTLAMATPNNIEGMSSPSSPKPARAPMLQMLSAAHIDLNWAEPSPVSLEGERRTRERTEREVDQSRGIMSEVGGCSAKQQLAIAQPLFAAAHHLAVNETQAAVDILLDSGEIDIAYALAKCFGLETARLLCIWADKCATLGDLSLALDILKEHPEAEIASGLLLSRYCEESRAKDILLGRGYRPLNWWINHAKEEEAIGSDAQAVTAYVIAQQHTTAIMMGMSVLKRLVRDPWHLSSVNYKVLDALKYINVQRVEDPLRSNFLSFMLWFCAHEAAGLGMMSTAANMLSILLTLGSRSSFPIQESDVFYQMFFFRFLAGQSEALSILDKLIGQDGFTPGPVSESLKALKLMAMDHITWERWQRQVQPQTVTLNDPAAYTVATNMLREIQKIGDALSLPSLSSLNSKKSRMSDVSNILSLLQSSNTVVLGSLLPVANQQLKNYISILSQARIQGNALKLNDDGAYIALNEAAQWRQVLPFSPLLNGELLNY
eukprot:gene5866-6460_t